MYLDVQAMNQQINNVGVQISPSWEEERSGKTKNELLLNEFHNLKDKFLYLSFRKNL